MRGLLATSQAPCLPGREELPIVVRQYTKCTVIPVSEPDILTQHANELGRHADWQMDMPWEPTEVWERLWIGGTPDEDTLLTAREADLGVNWSPSANVKSFDAVVTLAASVGPAGTGVREYRAGLVDLGGGEPDSEMVLEAVNAVVAWHAQGLRVLVRCRAGMNRSGLVTALALTQIADLNYDQAVELLRTRRGPKVLYNPILHAYGKRLTED